MITGFQFMKDLEGNSRKSLQEHVNVSGGGPPLQEDLPSQWSGDCDIKGEGRTITWTRGQDK